MEGIRIIVIFLIAYDVTLTIICAKLYSIISENKFKSEIDRTKLQYLEKKSNLNKESIDLLLQSLKDLNGIVKKIVKGNDDTNIKPDVNALVAGWKADDDEQEKQELFSAIAEACNSGMLLQSALLAQGFAQMQQCIYPLQQLAIMPPIWNTSGNVNRRLGD